MTREEKKISIKSASLFKKMHNQSVRFMESPRQKHLSEEQMGQVMVNVAINFLLFTVQSCVQEDGRVGIMSSACKMLMDSVTSPEEI